MKESAAKARGTRSHERNGGPSVSPSTKAISKKSRSLAEARQAVTQNPGLKLAAHNEAQAARNKAVEGANPTGEAYLLTKGFLFCTGPRVRPTPPGLLPSGAAVWLEHERLPIPPAMPQPTSHRFLRYVS